MYSTAACSITVTAIELMIYDYYERLLLICSLSCLIECIWMSGGSNQDKDGSYDARTQSNKHSRIYI
jgi:hypothetical protein